jgi:hypothetical protein
MPLLEISFQNLLLPELHGNDDGNIPATFEVIYMVSTLSASWTST